MRKLTHYVSRYFVMVMCLKKLNTIQSHIVTQGDHFISNMIRAIIYGFYLYISRCFQHKLPVTYQFRNSNISQLLDELLIPFHLSNNNILTTSGISKVLEILRATWLLEWTPCDRTEICTWPYCTLHDPNSHRFNHLLYMTQRISNKNAIKRGEEENRNTVLMQILNRKYKNFMYPW